MSKIDETTFLRAARQLDMEARRDNRSPGLRLVEHLANSALETDYRAGTLSSAQQSVILDAAKRWCENAGVARENA